MKPRAIWTGCLKISLVTIPIRLYTALNESEKVTFNQLHKGCHQRLKQQLVCPVHGKVERADIVKGYELEKDRFVVVEPSELEALRLETTGSIEMVQFISQDEFDPLLLDTPYYLGPDGLVARQAFVVFREALKRSQRVGFGRVLMAGRERLVALAPVGEKGLLLMTLRYPADFRPAAPYFEDIGDVNVDEAQVTLAQRLIENQTAPFNPAAFIDRYQAALLDTIKAKLNGAQPTRVLGAETSEAVNFMTALQKSVDQAVTVKAPANGHKPLARVARVRQIVNKLGTRAASRRASRNRTKEREVEKISM